ncbi:hypothetical protein RB195_001783 [Necator americanus]|uniref:Uncharacterized protein n=1 Tax=Necator americanus TaxID=51031 RepID=A0ABR1DGG5_NECAM
MLFAISSSLKKALFSILDCVAPTFVRDNEKVRKKAGAIQAKPRVFRFAFKIFLRNSSFFLLFNLLRRQKGKSNYSYS